MALPATANAITYVGARPTFVDSERVSWNMDPDLLEQELEERLQEALTSLPEKQRAAMLLVWEGDFSYEQIALELGRSLSATKTLIHRGRHTLRQKLQFGGLAA